MTATFLRFSAGQGNDLSTPRPEFGLPGAAARRSLVPVRAPLAGGAARWFGAMVALEATEESALAYCSLEDLQSHAAPC